LADGVAGDDEILHWLEGLPTGKRAERLDGVPRGASLSWG
jgi:hypothetical protein